MMTPIGEASLAIPAFGQYLIDQGVMMPKALEEALTFDRTFGVGLIQASTKLGLVRENDVSKAASDYLERPVLDRRSPQRPDAAQIEETLARLDLSPEWLGQNAALVWTVDAAPGAETALHVAARDPFNPRVSEEIARRWVGPTQHWIALASVVDSALAELASRETVSSDDDQAEELARLRELAEEAPVIEFVNRLFSVALDRNASDIHIEPSADGFTTRLRVDGVLSDGNTHPISMFDSVVTRIKILSGMDIAERRLPQDGRQTVRVAGEEVDLRVSSLPATAGESIVIRLLRKKSDLPDMEGLGLRDSILERFQRLIDLPNGVFLVTGPTGSGKSTTLYRALEHLNRGETKLITIEDPVEYDVAGVNQVQVHAEIGLTFAKGLRSMLRQDPDIIMVGEIRDRETAEVAIQAALTGHLVFSTLHTNSARGAVERLIDLGVEPFLLAAALRGVLGQRLLRRVCPSCRVEAPTTDSVMIRGLLSEAHSSLIDECGDTVYAAGEGCAACSGTGYAGRIGVFELVDLESIRSNLTNDNIAKMMTVDVLRNFGYRTMLEDGLIKVSQGETTLDEIERVFGRWR